MFSIFWQCLNGPRLYRYHGSSTVAAHAYPINDLELYADRVIIWIRFFKAFSYWTSPVWFPFLYKRGTISTMEGLIYVATFTGVFGIVFYTAIMCRGIGRYMNPEYKVFLNVISKANKDCNKDNRLTLAAYDSEFFAWPVDFNCKNITIREDIRTKMHVDEKQQMDESSFIGNIGNVFLKAISYVCVHSFGRRLVYPGSTSMQYLMHDALLQGRSQLIEKKHGNRIKLKTLDNNEIDAAFIDNRNSAFHANGDTLVICCEGNAGFYEIGIMNTPYENGYSVLGWNHPGFGGSTGIPFPSQDQNAIDCVMKYAIYKLGFLPENIIVYGWSIGGYSSLWLAAKYPDMKGIILDATFDEIMPLAKKQFPGWWMPMVKIAVRDYFNLNNSELVKKYSGPILLIRRTQDEVITTEPPGVLSGNRGNYLLLNLFKYRYPNIMSEIASNVLLDWLSGNSINEDYLISDDEFYLSSLKSYVLENSYSYPMLIGESWAEDAKVKMALYLSKKYMVDFSSTHCMPLSKRLFTMPWTISLE